VMDGGDGTPVGWEVSTKAHAGEYCESHSKFRREREI